ncbi:MAG TPA: aminotransferase class I/II-fold pyridoxal phosphate-dependent enzyme [Acidimicrobiia bacterium]|nr:aminotransferase class I/II-fold pyridoxal phosphate-dependent enzyme [Acidimicrobiia bacterium]
MVGSPDSGGVSERARRMVTESTIAPYIVEHIHRSAPPRDPDYLCLAVAENHLMWDLISEKANAVRNVGPSAFGYEDMRGSLALRTALARFLGDHLFGCEVDTDSIVVMAGAGSVVEALAWALVDPGGGVLIPTPSYAGYWNDIEARARLRAVPAHTRSEGDFRITEDVLTSAADTSAVPIGALLLTNPSNPLGRTLTDDEVRRSIDWARGRGMPIIMNEVYGLSIHGDTPFRSAASMLGGIPDDVHFIWAFSKDFASSGLRGGVAVTSNRTVHDVLMQHLYFSAVSGDTQHLMASMLDDRDWFTRYLAALRQRLGRSYQVARSTLEAQGVPSIGSDSGIFLLADFRHHLDSPTWEAEDRLWRRILEQAGVNLTPGSACRNVEPGFMRVCHASAPSEVVRAGLERVASSLAR